MRGACRCSAFVVVEEDLAGVAGGRGVLGRNPAALDVYRGVVVEEDRARVAGVRGVLGRNPAALDVYRGRGRRFLLFSFSLIGWRCRNWCGPCIFFHAAVRESHS
jgi:hypothetical protein